MASWHGLMGGIRLAMILLACFIFDVFVVEDGCIFICSCDGQRAAWQPASLLEGPRRAGDAFA